MVAASVIIEPNSSGIVNYTLASYRQLRFEVRADSIVPANQPMYADIYVAVGVGAQFYKTLTSYTIEQNGGGSVFVFDIQDALQEYIQQFIPDLSTGFFVLPGFAVESDALEPFQETVVVVYFRGSTFSGGLLIPEPTAPTQGTATTAPVNTFSGLPCNQFITAKATILPGFETVFDNNLEERLYYNLQFTPIGGTRIYGLSNLPQDVSLIAGGNTTPDVCPTNYTDQPGAFPIMIMEFDSGALSANCTYYIQFSHDGVVPIPIYPAGGTILLYATPQLLTTGTWYIPLGLKEIINNVPTLAPILNNAGNNIYYRIIVSDDDAGQIAFITPSYRVAQNPKNSNQNVNVLWFQNAYGHFEQVSFIRMDKDLDVTSSEQFTPYTQTGTLINSDTNNPLQVGHKKFNVRANETITLTALFPEQLMPWLSELFASPYILMRIRDYRTYPFPSTSTKYLLQTVTIVSSSQKIKLDPVTGGKKYSVTVKVVPSVEYIVPRN